MAERGGGGEGGKVGVTLPVAPMAPIPYASPTITWPSGEPAPAFYDWRTTYPFLAGVRDAAPAIWDELRRTTRWFDWPETSLYSPEAGDDWKVYPFLHTFPATDPSRSTWIETSVAECPYTTSVLRAIPGIRTALFSRMGPHTSLATHQGWADLANHVLRCHLALHVPDEEARPCGVVVGDEIVHHVAGELIVFDDSKHHSAFNNHASKARYVLIFDVMRPPGLPLGQATGSTTDELEGFIAAFK